MTTEFDIEASSDFSLEKLLTRAQTSEGALAEAATNRRDSLARLTEFVRDLSAANGDLLDRIELMEATKSNDDQVHAEEIADLMERLRTTESKLNEAIAETTTQKAHAKARELELTGELSRLSEQYGLLGREFQRFVEQVENETQNSVESERSISMIENHARSTRTAEPAQRPAVASVRTVQPAPSTLAQRDNLILMPTPAIRPQTDEALDEVSEILQARDGFGGMFKGA